MNDFKKQNIHMITSNDFYNLFLTFHEDFLSGVVLVYAELTHVLVHKHINAPPLNPLNLVVEFTLTVLPEVWPSLLRVMYVQSLFAKSLDE